MSLLWVSANWWGEEPEAGWAEEHFGPDPGTHHARMSTQIDKGNEILKELGARHHQDAHHVNDEDRSESADYYHTNEGIMDTGHHILLSHPYNNEIKGEKPHWRVGFSGVGKNGHVGVFPTMVSPDDDPDEEPKEDLADTGSADPASVKEHLRKLTRHPKVREFFQNTKGYGHIRDLPAYQYNRGEE